MSDWNQYCSTHMDESARVKLAAKVCIPALIQAAELTTHAFINGKKLLLCGNGGSAADCQHLAAEFVSSQTRRLGVDSQPHSLHFHTRGVFCR